MTSKMPSKWRICKLGEMAAIQTGISGAIDKNRDDGCPLLTVSSVSPVGDLQLEGHAFVDASKVIEDKMLKRGDLLFNWRNGSQEHMGKTALFRGGGHFTFVSFLYRIRPHDGLDAYFLHQYLKFLKDQGHFARGKSAFSQDRLSALPIVVPPLKEQMGIGRILQTFERGRNQAADLVGKAERHQLAIRDHFFTKENRYPRFSGDLLRHPFQAFVSCITDGFHPSKNAPVPCVELENLEKRTGSLLGYKMSHLFKKKKWQFREGDILFSKLRPKSKKYHLAKMAGVCSTEIMVMRPRPGMCDPSYLYGLVQTSTFSEKTVSSGSAIPRIKWESVAPLMFRLPSLQEQRAIGLALALAEQGVDEARTNLEGQLKLNREMRHVIFTRKRTIPASYS